MPVARSLARAGIRVVAAGLRGDVIPHSRYCTQFTALPDDPEAQLAWLLTRPGGEVLLPCSDDTLEVMARAHEELTAHGYILPEASPAVVLAMLDKDQTYRLARQAAIPVPAWRTFRFEDGPPAELHLPDRPCVVKPVHRHRFQRVTGNPEKVIFAPTPEILRALVRELVGAGLDVMITEVVPGPDSALWSYQTYIDSEGAPLFELTIRKLRQEPPGFGVASLAVGERNPEVAALGRRFAAVTGLRGPVEIEFKRDCETGELELIECNHRLNFLVELVHHSGFDVALLTYARAVGEAPPTLGPARWGYRLWDPVSDLRGLRQQRQNRDVRLLEVIRSVARMPLCSTVWALDDPRPGLLGMGNIIRKRFARAGAGLLAKAEG